MKKFISLLIAAIMVFALCVPAFADETAKADPSPVVGSWRLGTVVDVSDPANPVTLDKADHASLYGEGINILTLDDDGGAHDNTFNAGDNADRSASWKEVGENAYEFTEGDTTIDFSYDAESDVLKRAVAEQNMVFVYFRAFLDTWKLDKVVEIHEGDAPVDVPKEGNQSLYGNSDNIIAFVSYNKAYEVEKDGADSAQVEGSWKLTGVDKFSYTSKDITTEIEYSRVDDTCYYDYQAANDQPHYRFIYARTVYVPEAAAAETETATAN